MSKMFSYKAAKILFFTYLQIGYNRKMIAKLFFDELILKYLHFFISKNIINPQHRRYAAKSTPQAAALFCKGII